MSMSYVAVCDNGDLNGTPFPSGTDNAQYTIHRKKRKSMKQTIPVITLT